MATVKKVRIPKQSLPPVTIPESNTVSVLSVVSTVSLESGAKVYEYVTSENHGYSPGDAVNISGISPSIFNAENVLVYAVTSLNSFQILGPSTSTAYVSGGSIYKTAGSYIVRYRVVSEDRNRLSHWSPLYNLSPVSSTAIDGDGIYVQTSNSTLSVTWDVPANSSLADFDVYVAWGAGITVPGSNEGVGSYTYQASVSGNFFSMPITDPDYTRVSVAIQTRTYPRKFWPEIVVAKSAIVGVV